MLKQSKLGLTLTVEPYSISGGMGLWSASFANT